jgi:gamma-glutamylcyclotransferase (GGCT)/AIG2-like uncharacterized protein YtfP
MVDSIKKVLVYGSLKKGFGNHDAFLSTATLLGTTKIPGKMYSLGAYPGVRLDEPGEIHCEVYSVDSKTLQRLDQLEGFRTVGGSNFYDRIPVRFTMEGESQVGDVYEINKHYINDKKPVPSGNWGTV